MPYSPTRTDRSDLSRATWRLLGKKLRSGRMKLTPVVLWLGLAASCGRTTPDELGDAGSSDNVFGDGGGSDAGGGASGTTDGGAGGATTIEVEGGTTAEDEGGIAVGDVGGTNGGDGGGAAGSTSFDAAVLDSALPDSSASTIETFELIYDSAVQTPLSCPTEHWEFPLASATVTVHLRNTGSVPLVYITENSWVGGAVYTPGVPTGSPGELVGILAPGASVDLSSDVYRSGDGGDVALVGASKPFSVYDGGYAASDEGTIPWPEGVTDSTGATTMYVAEVQDLPNCEPVVRMW